MGIEIVHVPYEILFRLGEDGQVKGCHQRFLELIRDDETGFVHSRKELDPQLITGELMEGILGTINTALTVTLADRDAQAIQLIDALNVAQSNADALAGENVLLIEQLSVANERIAAPETANAGAE